MSDEFLTLVAAAAASPPATPFVQGTREGPLGTRDYRALAYYQNALFDQCSGDRCTGTGEDPGKGRPGNAHPVSGRLLIEPLEIGKAKSFQLVQAQLFGPEGANRATDRLEGTPPECGPLAL